MKAFALFVGLMLSASVAFAQGAGPLEGTWNFKSFSSDGKEDPADKVKDMTFVVTGDKYKVVQGGKDIETGSFKLGKAGDVDTIDFAVESGEDKGKAQPGIYKLEGTSVKIAYFEEPNPARPTELASKDGQAFATLEKAAAK